MIDRLEADYTFLIYGDRIGQADLLGWAIASYPAQANPHLTQN